MEVDAAASVQELPIGPWTRRGHARMVGRCPMWGRAATPAEGPSPRCAVREGDGHGSAEAEGIPEVAACLLPPAHVGLCSLTEHGRDPATLPTGDGVDGSGARLGPSSRTPRGRAGGWVGSTWDACAPSPAALPLCVAMGQRRSGEGQNLASVGGLARA